MKVFVINETTEKLQRELRVLKWKRRVLREYKRILRCCPDIKIVVPKFIKE